MRGSVLVVDDEAAIRLTFTRSLSSAGHRVYEAEDGAAAIRLFETKDPDLVLLDLKLPDCSGIELLDRFRSQRPDAMVVIVTSQTDVRYAVEAMRKGAFDYLAKPVNLEHLRILVDRVLSVQRTNSELDRFRRERAVELGEDFVLGEGSPMRSILETVRQVAESETTTVLIEGESGTGKELIAHRIHRLSSNAEGPFLDLNCASLPESLLESELFGHEKGAFTDAHAAKKGLFELADGGTLFLDEVGEMSGTIQAKLLRALERMIFRRVGGVEDIRVGARIVSATNRDLAEEVRRGRFREDLYYRLKVIPLRLPPLRERPEDVPVLAAHFLRLYGGRFRRSIRGFTPDAMDALRAYAWPGNIREMRNLIERTVLLGHEEWIDREALGLPAHGMEGAGGTLLQKLERVLDGRIPHEGYPLETELEAIERRVILRAAEAAEWNQTKTSRLLHMNRDKLRYRMKQYDLRREEPASS
ncbi:MAG: sigma-54-dependent Fis family transcriptional regulator [Candidatus Eisenbacteria bacterium]|nr:sigma-54-dependent Fis family transcriptional regulator [Candidatus Eisenbacteria bacterium]